MSGPVTVGPDGCICPTESYTCRADLVTFIEIENMNLSDSLGYRVGSSASQPIVEREGLRVTFSEEMVDGTHANLTAVVSILDIQRWNGSSFICRTTDNGNLGDRVTIICITGKILNIKLKTIINQHRSSLSSQCSVSGVGPTISCGQFPVSGVWRRMCGPLCGHWCQ